MHEYLKSLFRYDDWANRECLSSLHSAGETPPRARDIMAHIVGAQLLWLERIHGRPPSMAVWPELTLPDCAKKLEHLAGEWSTYLDRLDDPGLLAEIDYQNSQGQPWSSHVRDILMHVALHGSYHRGQIAMLLGQNGKTAAYTGFIHCVRQGLVE